MSEVGSMYPLRSTLNQYERSMVGFHSHPGDSAAILAFLHWTPAGDLPHHRRYPKAAHSPIVCRLLCHRRGSAGFDVVDSPGSQAYKH